MKKDFLNTTLNANLNTTLNTKPNAKWLLAPLTCLLLGTTTGCDAKEPVADKKPETYTSDQRLDEVDGKKLLPFQVAFTVDGEVVFIDKDGSAERWEDAKLPLPAAKINYIQNLSVVVYTGSCVVLVQTPYGPKQKSYPDWVCAALNAQQ